MNLFSRVGIPWLIFLVLYCTVLISVVLFICQLGVSTIFYFNDGKFHFLWEEALYIALKKGSIAGVVLGAGVWLKNKLHERHGKR
ncbi:TPA: hypothetical protein I9Y23_004352 [Kluyvera ascorbata]|uniref:Immunity protein n=1 Tax=Kluyvera genomosp. 2 TaxID=2774054 RepID=A0A2T2XWR2_9ENTR|nr:MULTISPECIES: hypothetical protein [Enterobacteriaceae]HAT3920658.1 hypothetical protein [Kluyvera ascorbata]PSR44734.1 hypothetical protein C8256_21475 [Kluyvera genomosp. 2]BBQ83573.1 hypothetical protein WP3W18E02_21020 [Klebsiella sp. WP3-W18-ESBL-02]BBR20596.1 hypothetical protein WP3S18E05_20760 [Klebsiella sp. WP3-S18-ESBL-05]HAT3945794.1 hypothetical protein [Kluyvera ascorbata]